jgi:2-oxoglutarate dehydrogenase E2 component (dihydrolipoamide succinyltransferase)
MDIVMPKMGESVSEGTIIKWHKKEGDQVKRDEIIFEISTDKVDTEIPSPVDGVVSQIKVQEGDTVEVGTVVAIIDSNGSVEQETKKQEEVKEVKQEKIQEQPDVKEKSELKVDKSEQNEKPATEVTTNGNIIEVAMPKMGESVMEGTIIKWYKKTGESVKKDETLFEISTDKVDTEVPAPQSGVLKEILVGEQETVDVDTVVAKISTTEIKVEPVQEKKEKIETEKQTTPEEKETPSAMHENFSKGTIERVEEKIQPEVNKEKEPEQTASTFFSPLVLNIAQKENVPFNELQDIKGTGLNGRVTKNDILAYIDKRKQEPQRPKVEEKPVQTEEIKRQEVKAAPAPSFVPSVLQPSYSADDVEKIPMDNIRQKIMEHMILSRDTSVHVTELVEVDMTKIHNYIQKKKDEFQQKESVKLTYLPFIAYASVKGLKEYSLINSSIEKNVIIRKKFINLGIAVAIEPTGLIVPNIKSADEKNIIGLAKSISDIAQKARTKKLTPDDISNGTFTITNYGVFGALFGTPIINQPEVAILGVGAVIKKPVVVEVGGSDAIAIKPMMYLTLSHDHRLVDGMLGGKFLKYIKDTLENFDETIM